jgi:hypothetical protein
MMPGEGVEEMRNQQHKKIRCVISERREDSRWRWGGELNPGFNAYDAQRPNPGTAMPRCQVSHDAQ